MSTCKPYPSMNEYYLTYILKMVGLPAVNDYNARLFTYYFKSVFPYIMPIIYPVGMIAQTGSVYLVSHCSLEMLFIGCTQ